VVHSEGRRLLKKAATHHPKGISSLDEMLWNWGPAPFALETQPATGLK
jgi:hypothetical protein